VLVAVPGAAADAPAAPRDEVQLVAGVLGAERRELAEHEARLDGFIATLNAEHQRIQQLKERVADTEPKPPVLMSTDERDQRYELVCAQLDDVVDEAIEVTGRLFGNPPRPPDMPHSLSAATLALPARVRDEVDALERRRERLEAKADQKAKLAVELQRALAEVLRARALQLNHLRLGLLPWLSGARHAQITGLTRRHAGGLHTELLLLRLEVTYWAQQRLDQLLSLPDTLANVGRAGAVAWKLLEVILLLLFLRWLFGRWDHWMQKVIAAMGRGLHLSGWTLTFARIAELARTFGPAGLVLLVSTAIYTRLGAGAAPVEVRIAYLMVYWFALMRMQLRFVQGAARSIGTRAIDRERQRRELELDDAAVAAGPEEHGVDDAVAAVALARTDRPSPKVAGWRQLARTWTILTRYVTVFIVSAALIELAVGRGLAYRAVTRLGWWGGGVVALWLLRIWRDNIIAWYQLQSTDSALCRFTERHAGRVYGSVIVLVALVALIGIRVVNFVETNLSNLDSTKRLLAFLFRRRVEKHARERGHVLTEPHTLPEELVEAFPTGPLSAQHRPTRPAFMDEIKAQFERWTQSKSEGSIALVGASGMGKTSMLRMLDAELGAEVIHGRVLTKVTGERQMVGTVARALGIDGDLSTVGEIVAAIQDDQRPVIALDDCHNLFLRRIGGFEAWEAFTQAVNESCDNVFWVCTFDKPAWEYLNDVSDRVSYFRQVIMMPPWTDEDIRRLILTNTRRARYRPNFTDLLVSRVEGVNVSTQIIGTAHGYFRLLWDFTNGNPRLATHFWLRSLVPDPDARRVRVHLFASPSVTELEELSDDMAFVLASVVEHENLTADELATVCNLPPEFCRFALRYLREGGYLTRDPATGRTYLSSHWQQTVIRYLKRKHLLYST